MTPALTRFAPAKVNLGLSVRELRADGYHALQSIMVPLTVGDELRIAPAAELTLTVEGADLPTGNNLVFRAARAYLDAAGVTGGAAITLRKRLPLASGLGGGSSDAATTLMALARLYPAEVALPELALRLGAGHQVPALRPGDVDAARLGHHADMQVGAGGLGGGLGQHGVRLPAACSRSASGAGRAGLCQRNP